MNELQEALLAKSTLYKHMAFNIIDEGNDKMKLENEIDILFELTQIIITSIIYDQNLN